MGLEKNPELPQVPLAIDLLSNSDDRKVLELIVLPQEFGRPFVAPPGVPADRMALYRKAFQAVLRDEQFRSESARQRLSLEAVGPTGRSRPCWRGPMRPPSPSTTAPRCFRRSSIEGFPNRRGGSHKRLICLIFPDRDVAGQNPAEMVPSVHRWQPIHGTI